MGTFKIAMMGLAGLGMAFAAAPTMGQTTPPSHLYHLRAGSMDSEGCFGACQCPALLPEPMRGSFALTPAAPDPLFQNYTVSDVHWRVPFFPHTLTGAGTYRIGGEVALQKEMSLQLTVDGGVTRAFDSGLTPAGTPGFPLIHVHLHVPSAVCWNMELDVIATPMMGDWNGDGNLQVQDIFDFLDSWFTGDGDANEDGATNLQDVFDFLNGWFAGS